MKDFTDCLLSEAATRESKAALEAVLSEDYIAAREEHRLRSEAARAVGTTYPAFRDSLEYAAYLAELSQIRDLL